MPYDEFADWPDVDDKDAGVTSSIDANFVGSSGGKEADEEEDGFTTSMSTGKDVDDDGDDEDAFAAEGTCGCVSVLLDPS